MMPRPSITGLPPTPWVAAFVGATLAGGCSTKPSPATGNAPGSAATAAAPAGAGSAVAPAADAPLPKGVGPAYRQLPLGPADAIEPPSRDIVPGMTIAEARAKGATGLDTDITLKWRPDTEVWIDDDTGLAVNLQVEYPPAEWEAVKQRWGTPTLDDNVWIGANWMASLNGCANGPCGVTFERAPMTLLTAAIAPPGAFAGLRPGMTKAEIYATCGVPFADIGGVTIGYGLVPAISFDDDRFESISFDASEGDAEDWLPPLTKQWGAPRALGDDKVWIDPAGAWLAQFDAFGSTIRFVPQTPLAAVLARTGAASALAAAQALLGKPVTAVAALAGWTHDADYPDEAWGRPNELSLQQVHLDTQTNDAELIVEVRVRLEVADEAAMTTLRTRLTAALGAIVKSKDADDNELETITVDGLRVLVETNDDALRLVFAKR